MAITKTTTPERLVVVWENGAIKGASVQHIETISEDGAVIHSKYTDPRPVDAVELAGLLDGAAADTLAANGSLQAQLVQAAADKTAAEQAAATATAERDAAAAELAALKASLQPVDAKGIPTSVTRFQARAALHLADLLSSVEAMMAAPETDMLAKLAWQDAQSFERNSPTVLAMAAALGLTDAQLDALFVQAASINA